MKLQTKHTVCAKCGGRCCKRSPGIWSPEDLGWPEASKLVRNIESHVHRGLAVFAREPDPALRGGEIWFLMPPWLPAPPPERPCALLRKHGCTLTFARRPEACRRLTPSIDRVCSPELGASDQYIRYRWIPLQEFVQQARRLFAKEQAI